MSTVIFFGEALFADTQVTFYDVKYDGADFDDIVVDSVSTTRKIHKLEDNASTKASILGFVGKTTAETDFIEWTKTGRSPNNNFTFGAQLSVFEFDGDTFTIWKLVHAGRKWARVGKWYQWKKVNYFKFVIKDEEPMTEKHQTGEIMLIATMGSGGQYARGYLDTNRDPVEAIKCAARHDRFTNKIIETVSVYMDDVERVYPKEEKDVS